MSKEEQVWRRAWAVRMSAFDRVNKLDYRANYERYLKVLEAYSRACRVYEWAAKRYFGMRHG